MPSGYNSTKEQLIDAGVTLFREGRASILRSLTAGDVAREAGFHRQTFYRHWETQDDYVSDLVSRVFAIPDFDSLSEVRLGVGRGHASFEESVRGLARREFDVVEKDEAMTVRVGLVAMGHVAEGPCSKPAMAYYRAVHESLRVRYGDLLDTWDRRVCPPFQLDDVILALQTQLAGILLHVALLGDPSRGKRLYMSTALSLLNDMTEPGADAATDGHATMADAARAPR